MRETVVLIQGYCRDVGVERRVGFAIAIAGAVRSMRKQFEMANRFTLTGTFSLLGIVFLVLLDSLLVTVEFISPRIFCT